MSNFLNHVDANKIRAVLHDKGISQNWLANQMGITKESMSRKLQNNRFSISEVFYMAYVLNVNVGVFLS